MDASAERRFRLLLALFCAVASVLPNLYASLSTPTGAHYLGVQYNTDDQMVYYAWIRQAMDGRLLFDNRFTTDAQPGLTFHLYFLLLGWLAKLVGIPLAAAIARFVLSGTFVWLLGGLVVRIAPENGFIRRMGPALAVFGAGAGFLVWHLFGTGIVRPVPWILDGLFLGRLPIDVWQPEALGFASMLTSGLFMAALCLILATLGFVLDARRSWRPVLPGAVAFGVLMNVHSYDALLVTLVLVGFLAMSVARGQADRVWVARALCIGAGAVPAALWFLHVLGTDPVFQARAATPTFSPPFQSVLFGLVGLIALAVVGLWMSGPQRRVKLGSIALLCLLAVGAVASRWHAEGFWMGPVAWGFAFATGLAVLVLVSGEDPAWNLVVSWAVVGTIALYFPALFQRKLAMGLGVPWALLASFGLAPVLARTELGKRQFAGTLAAILLCATSALWLARQFWFIRTNVANTTVHPVFIGADAWRAVRTLGALDGRHVALAMPGVPQPAAGADGTALADDFGPPYMPDLNPVLSGLAGTYTFAGHWSETPDYERRRSRLTRFFLAATSPEERSQLLKETGAEYIVAPVPEAFPALPLADVSVLGRIVQDGTQFRLVAVN